MLNEKVIERIEFLIRCYSHNEKVSLDNYDIYKNIGLENKSDSALFEANLFHMIIIDLNNILIHLKGGD